MTCMIHRVARLAAVAPLLCAGLAACEDTRVAANTTALRVECAQSDVSLDSSAWICPEALILECTGGDGTQDVDVIHLVADADGQVQSCQDADLAVDDPGPYTVGTHQIVILALSQSVPVDGGTANGAASAVCAAALRVVDREPPVLVPREIQLWPPNHAMHTITVQDCVDATDSCDGERLDLQFTHALSDEPDDGRGDGHHQPDIVLDDCGSVRLRAERQGGGNGRVYTLGVRGKDGAGNVSETHCHVTVPHDQGGGDAVDDGVAIAVTLDADC